jgi:uncharacterized membrane protein YfcA
MSRPSIRFQVDPDDTRHRATPGRIRALCILVFAATAVTGGLLGGRLAGWVRPERLSIAFTLLLIAVASIVARALPHLV